MDRMEVPSCKEAPSLSILGKPWRRRAGGAVGTPGGMADTGRVPYRSRRRGEDASLFAPVPKGHRRPKARQNALKHGGADTRTRKMPRPSSRSRRSTGPQLAARQITKAGRTIAWPRWRAATGPSNGQARHPRRRCDSSTRRRAAPGPGEGASCRRRGRRARRRAQGRDSRGRRGLLGVALGERGLAGRAGDGLLLRVGVAEDLRECSEGGGRRGFQCRAVVCCAELNSQSYGEEQIVWSQHCWRGNHGFRLIDFGRLTCECFVRR
jgi:hypothetical protein